MTQWPASVGATVKLKTMLYRTHRRFTAWLALLAVVMGALAPTVSQALVVVSDRGDWLEVCTTTGVVWVKASSAADADGERPMAAHEQVCDICTHTGKGAPPAPAGLSTHQSNLAPLRSPAHPASAHPAVLWTPAQSRAPPLFA